MGSLGLRLDIAFATGFVIETGVFSAYTCLFIAALPGMTKKRRLRGERGARSAWVFLIFSILMYIVAALHLALSGIRFYKSLFSTNGTNGAILYLMDLTRWELLWQLISICVQTWLGDALVIYRCYCVWNNNLWIISIPVGLLLGSIGVNAYVLYWVGHLDIKPPSIQLSNSIYPLAFVQNFMTTSLIVLKIYLTHRESQRAGIVDMGAKLRMIQIVRIVIESAGIYTIQLFILNILYFVKNNFQFVMQSFIIPSIGITFLLLALRIEASRSHQTTTTHELGLRSSMIPRWLRPLDDSVDSDGRHDASSMRGGEEIEVVERQLSKILEETRGDAESNHWDSGLSSSTTLQAHAALDSKLKPENIGPSGSDLVV